MQGKRTERVAALLQMELSNLILERIKDPRLGFVTVMHVKITPDLKSAVVFISVMGDKKKKEETLKVLERAAGFLQHEVGVAIKMRYTPKLQFELDDSLDKDFEIGQVIRKIEEKDKPHPPSKDLKVDGTSPGDLLSEKKDARTRRADSMYFIKGNQHSPNSNQLKRSGDWGCPCRTF